MKKPIIFLSVILFLFNGTHVIGMQQEKKTPIRKLRKMIKQRKISPSKYTRKSANKHKLNEETACSKLLKENPNLIEQIESGSVNSKELETLFNEEIERIYKQQKQRKAHRNKCRKCHYIGLVLLIPVCVVAIELIF